MSVILDFLRREVRVTLPFMKDPVAHFKELYKKYKKFMGKFSNYCQALKRLISNCRKPEHIKEGIKLVFQDLLERGFIIKLTDAPEEIKTIINASEVLHFYHGMINGVICYF